MRRINRILCVFLAMALLCGFAWAAPGVSIAAIPPNGIFSPGDTVKIPVELSENPGIACGDVTATWDPAALELTAVEFGVLPDNGTAPIAGSAPGRFTVCIGDDLALQPFTATGVAFTLTFKVLAAGSGTVTLLAEDGSFLNGSWEPVPAQAAGCTLELRGDVPKPELKPVTEKTADGLLKNAILLPVGSYAALVKGGVTAIYPGERSVTAYIKNNRTYVPLRFVAEKLGAKVDWDNATRTVTVEKSGHKLLLPVGSTTCTLDGVTLPLDAPAEIKENRTMIPLRLVAEGLQYQVEWDAANRAAIVADGETWDMTGAVEQEAIATGLGMIAMYKGFV